MVGGQSPKLRVFEDNRWEPPHLAFFFGSEVKHTGKALELHLTKAEDLVEVERRERQIESGEVQPLPEAEFWRRVATVRKG